MAKFAHDAYDLDEKTGMLSRKDGLCLPATAEERNAETCSVLEAVTDFIQAQMISLGLMEYWIPDGEDSARCKIFTSDLTSCTKLLIILQNQVGSKPGLWSRSLCLSRGLHAGSMLTAIERATSAGYAVAVLNPNTNSVGSTLQGHKRPIVNSFSPENHVLHVWDSLVAPSKNLNSIYLLTYGNGSSLAVDIVPLRAFKDKWCAAPRTRMRLCIFVLSHV